MERPRLGPGRWICWLPYSLPDVVSICWLLYSLPFVVTETTCAAGYAHSFGGCTACGMGTFMPIDGHTELSCFGCPTGKFMPNEGASECDNCSVPICARRLTYCDPYHGGAQAYEYYGASASSIMCEAADPLDVCDQPQYCRDDAAQCRLWPDNRHTMSFPTPCPSIHGESASDFACWDHRTKRGGLAHGTSSPDTVTIGVPRAARRHAQALRNGTHCGGTAVSPQYRFYLFACKSDAIECTDFKVDCPSVVASDVWWESYADTLFESNFTTEPTVIGRMLHNASDPRTHVDGRTIHALVNIYEDEGSTAKLGYMLRHHICISRTKVRRMPCLKARASTTASATS